MLQKLLNKGFTLKEIKKYWELEPQTNLAIRPITRKFGVEIEGWSTLRRDYFARRLFKGGVKTTTSEYNSSTTAPEAWTIMRDGSIDIPVSRGHAVEVISPILQGVEGLSELHHVCKALDSDKLFEDYKLRINDSCGLHVHFDLSDLDESTLKRIYDIYSHCQEEINLFLSHARIDNDKCLELETNDTWKQLFLDYNKYLAVRRTPHTIEFRQLQSTIDFTTIAMWISMMQSIIDVAEADSVSTFGNLQDSQYFRALIGSSEFGSLVVLNYYNEVLRNRGIAMPRRRNLEYVF